MAAGYRALGPRNASLPQATATVIGFMRNPDRFPWQRYIQLVPLETVTEGMYRYPVIEPDAPARLVNYGEFAWGWDDKRPSGEGFQPRITWPTGETKRYAFGYTLGDRTQGAWTRNTNINPQNLYSRIRLGHAMLHRSSRAVDAVRGYSWPTYNTANLNTLLGTSGAGFDLSSGLEQTTAGNPNPNFQIIKRAQNVVMRRLDLLTNGAVNGDEFVMVMGPIVAQKIAESGEIVNYLKQQVGAKADLMVRNGKWGIPDSYNGFQLVVEDTPRVFIRATTTTTTFADPTAATAITGAGAVVAYNERDYIWNDDSVMFCSRAGGLDGQYGEQNFSTVQMFYYGGLANVQGRSDAWNQIIEGSIDIEDDFKVAAPISGFLLTDVLTT